MRPAPNTRIGHFEILGPLGAGGMGVVYRARDTRLDRIVAIKGLPGSMAGDAERLARFDREARLLAALDHPNIAAIHGLEQVEGAPYLVLEYVGGETLAQRLARGPMSVREALDVAIQIAAAIEAAHERGIVHRDLKPGNVMLTPSGSVKVLDFGLARRDDLRAGSQDLSNVSTIGEAPTEPGAILGTAPYMSPEQARGQDVDRRTDVWAFGCLLYECLTGRRAFGGGTAADQIVHVLEREPDWTALPRSTPPRLRELVQRCLVKDARERPRDIGDLRRELSAIAAGPTFAKGMGTQPSSDTPSLAVLYFENQARDDEGEYFCSGVTEDILTDLSRLTGLRVVSRNAVARYRGAPADIRQVGAELGVGAVLQGTMRRSGDRVRITAQLVNARDGFQLWADRYDRTLQDVFSVQEEIATAIANAMKVALTPAEAKRLTQDRPHDARAYDLYLQGRARYHSFTPEGMREAMRLFRQATTIDPDYALAWAGIADCHGQFIQYGVEKPEVAGPAGLEAARRAIEANPGLAEAHKACALVLHMMNDPEGAGAALVRAVEANPRHVPAVVNLGVHLFDHADVAGAERLLRRAIEIDRQYAFPVAWLSERLWVLGRHDESLFMNEHLRRISAEPIFITHSWVNRAWAHFQRRSLDEADDALRAGLADGADPLGVRAMEALLAAGRARQQDARAHLQQIEAEPRFHPPSAGVLAVAAAYVQLGDLESASRWVARPILRNAMPMLARLVPELHPLLDLPALAPRRRDVTLVWPLEGPAIDPARRALFRDVRVESGIPQAGDVPGTAAG